MGYEEVFLSIIYVSAEMWHLVLSYCKIITSKMWDDIKDVTSLYFICLNVSCFGYQNYDKIDNYLCLLNMF